MNSYGSIRVSWRWTLENKANKTWKDRNARLLETRHVKKCDLRLYFNEKRKCYKNTTLHNVVWKSYGSIRVSHC